MKTATFILLITSASSAISYSLLDTSIKGLLLILAALAIVTLVRSISAATRHLVLLTAVIALPIIPFLTWALPSWKAIPAIKQPLEWVPAEKLTSLGAPAFSSTEGSEALAGASSVPGPSVQGAPQTTLVNGPIMNPFSPADVTTAASGQTTTSLLALPSEIPFLIIGIWLAISTVLLLRLLASRIRLCELEDTAHRIQEGALAEAVEKGCNRLGISRSIQVLQGKSGSMPMTWGVWNPQLLLPQDAENWDARRLQSVVLHELAHVKRGDVATQLLVQVVCSLFWFNPLVWIAAWRIRTDRERACDDLVLSHGVAAPDYAENLLQVVTGCEELPKLGGTAVAMAEKARIEGRLRSILKPNTNRKPTTRNGIIATVALCALAIMPLAMLQAEDDDTKVEEEATESSEESDAFAGDAVPADEAAIPAASDDTSDHFDADETAPTEGADLEDDIALEEGFSLELPEDAASDSAPPQDDLFEDTIPSIEGDSSSRVRIERSTSSSNSGRTSAGLSFNSDDGASVSWIEVSDSNEEDPGVSRNKLSKRVIITKTTKDGGSAIIEANAALPHQEVVKLVQALKEAGIDNVSIRTTSEAKPIPSTGETIRRSRVTRKFRRHEGSSTAIPQTLPSESEPQSFNAPVPAPVESPYADSPPIPADLPLLGAPPKPRRSGSSLNAPQPVPTPRQPKNLFGSSSVFGEVEPAKPRISQHRNQANGIAGIGCVLSPSKDHGGAIVQSVVADSPAHSAGIRAGDRIVAIARDDEGPLVNVRKSNLVDIINLCRGVQGSKVRLLIVPKDAQDEGLRREVVLKRDFISAAIESATPRLPTVRSTASDAAVEVHTFSAETDGRTGSATKTVASPFSQSRF